MLMHYMKDDNNNYLLGVGGRSEKKRLYAVNSKQDGGRSEEKRRSTEDLFLDGSFLTC
jgi:hypothetical protein